MNIPVESFPKTLQKKAKLYISVYDAIYDMSKSLEPGTVLPGEQEFANYWNVSRGTVREALYHLLEDGVVYKSQGKKTVISERSGRDGHSFSSLCHPVLEFAIDPHDEVRTKYEIVPTSDWLAGHLGLATGVPLLRGEFLYLRNGSDIAVSVFFCAFSLLEKLAVNVADKDSYINFIHDTVYKEADYSLSSLCVIDETFDSETHPIPLPVLLLEEFLHKDGKCFIFFRHYLGKDDFRIKAVRRNG